MARIDLKGRLAQLRQRFCIWKVKPKLKHNLPSKNKRLYTLQL